MSGLRTSMSTILALVMLIASVLNVVLVECSTGIDHRAIELVGHQLEAHICPTDPAASTSCAHKHQPEDCEDSSLLDDATTVQRASAADQAAPAVVAVLPPAAPWILVPIQARSQPQLCPRPPPRLRQTIDDLATVRLLI